MYSIGNTIPRKDILKRGKASENKTSRDKKMLSEMVIIGIGIKNDHNTRLRTS